MSASRIVDFDRQPESGEEEYTVSSPDGRSVKITKAAFDAITEAREKKADGKIIFELRNGGIAGVELQKRFR